MFLNQETAEDALEPMLTAGSRISRVRRIQATQQPSAWSCYGLLLAADQIRVSV